MRHVQHPDQKKAGGSGGNDEGKDSEQRGGGGGGDDEKQEQQQQPPKQQEEESRRRAPDWSNKLYELSNERIRRHTSNSSSHHHRSPNKKKKRRLSGHSQSHRHSRDGYTKKGGDEDRSSRTSRHPPAASAAAAAAGAASAGVAQAPVGSTAGQAAAAAHAAAAAAAAAAEAPEDPLLLELLDHFRVYLAAEGGSSGADAADATNIDMQKARNVLEATAGNVQMAAQLYWDDYFASEANVAKANGGSKHHRSGLRLGADRQRNDNGESDDEPAGSGCEEEADGGNPIVHRRIRRSLDKDFGKAAADDDDHDMLEEGVDEEDNDDANEEVEEPRQHQAQQIQEQRLIADALAGQQARRRQRAEMGESVSVSDDETGGVGGVFGFVGGMVAQMEEDDAPSDQQEVSSRGNRRVLSGNNENRRIREVAAALFKREDVKETSDGKKDVPSESEDDNDDYIGDSDWLDEDDASSHPPLDLLWGASEQASSSSPAVNDNGAEGNVIADEDADEENSGSGIPHTWLNASFTLSSCGTGLVMKSPKAEDIEMFAYNRQQNNGGRSDRNPGVPAPYHCKAVTAILSIVTAILYSGASIQGREVNCTSSKKPFSELTQDERKRQFESRLADALSALIFLASKASMERKERALRKARSAEMQNDFRTKNMQHRINLVPTCNWKEKPSSGIPRPTEGPLYQLIQLETSFTNVHDIRVFVLSSMRCFTAPGGVALLLETILRIHGKGVVARMVRRARQEANLPVGKKSLIACTCEERQKKMLEENPLPASSRNITSRMFDTTPPGHECVTSELISLILTGRVYSTWKGWSTQGLCFGVLSNKLETIGWQLARPEKPIWLLRGETCYSVLWLERGEKETVPLDISRLDRPGSVLHFTHWNCWYGQQNKSGMRLITAPGKWTPESISKKTSLSSTSKNSAKPRSVVEQLMDRREKQRINIISADEHEANEEQELQCRITDEELERAHVHPDDERFYPGKYRMWRFDMGGDSETTNNGMDELKQRGEHWVPHHRLSDRQKLVVDIKLGPKIKSILWTRWPRATIDSFTPTDGPPPIV